MLKNEVGNDSAATAVRKAVNDNALINEFSESLSEPKTWLIGGAAAAATVAATVAAAKYGRPLFEAARTAVNDLTVTGAIKEATAGAQAESRFMTPALDALTQRSIPIAMRDATRGETGILGVVRKDGSIDTDVDAVLKMGIMGHSKVDAVLAHELPHGMHGSTLRTAEVFPNTPFAPGLNDLRALLKTNPGDRPATDALLSAGKRIDVAARNGVTFKELNSDLPLFPTMDDMRRFMPPADSINQRVNLVLDGVERGLTLTQANSVVLERALRFFDKPGALKALAAQMPKPSSEADIIATAGRMAHSGTPQFARDQAARGAGEYMKTVTVAEPALNDAAVASMRGTVAPRIDPQVIDRLHQGIKA